MISSYDLRDCTNNNMANVLYFRKTLYFYPTAVYITLVICCGAVVAGEGMEMYTDLVRPSCTFWSGPHRMSSSWQWLPTCDAMK